MTNTEKAFIEEIVKNHGVDSMQYIWAMSTVREGVHNRARKTGK